MLKVNNLTFRYNRKENLFTDLDLQMKSGYIYGLLGKNGAGKTTLLKLLGGLRFPNQGTCRAFGYDAYKRSPEFLKEIYFVPEEFHTPTETIFNYIKYYSPFYPNFNNEQMMDLMKEFNLETNKKISSFSYGQKKKFFIAFGVATNCKLLILDEPTNGLDIPAKSKFRKILASSINSDRTYIVSTHQVRDTDKLIDPIIILDEGKVVFNHSIEEVLSKLHFDTTGFEPEPTEIIYSERGLGGYHTVRKNKNEEESIIDLEILFNAVTTEPAKIADIFQTIEGGR